MRLITFLFALFLTTSASLFGQVYSPTSVYGRYGYGILSDPSTYVAEGMGGVSLGIRNPNFVNPLNPASYSSADSLHFTFDFGADMVFKQFLSQKGHYSRLDASISHFSTEFRLHRKIGLGFGFLPYSKIGYKLVDRQTKNNKTFFSTYEGKGGINKFFIGLGFSPVSFLSVGANVSCLVGNTSYVRNWMGAEKSESSDNLAIVPFSQQQTIRSFISAFNFDIGLQFMYSIRKNERLTIGATFTPLSKGKADLKIKKKIFNTSDSDGVTYKTENKKEDTQFPMSFGLGVAYEKGNNLLLAFDATYKQWKGIKYPSTLSNPYNPNGDQFNDQLSLRAGFQYIADHTAYSIWKRLRLRGGLSYENSYLAIPLPNQQKGKFNVIGINAGVGFPVFDNYTGFVTMVNLSAGFQKLLPNNRSMISENIFHVTLGVNLNELWFFKRTLN